MDKDTVQGLPILLKEPYLFSGQVTLTANSAGQIIFNVSGNFSFLFHKFSYTARVNSANIIPYFDVEMLRDSTKIFSDYVPSEVFAGMTAELSTAPDTRYVNGLANWFKFDAPCLCPAKSTVTINLRDTSGAANTVRFVLAGTKLVHSYN